MDGEYRVLYRRWRPQTWRDVVGQQHVVQSLRNAMTRSRIAHAYLLSGPRGTGKTTIAKILARAVNCDAPEDGEPCGTCPPCKRIAKGASTDVLEMDAASNRGIEEIRALREQARFAPVEERIKVYIVDEVHMLTMEAANALLKTLEEPPPRLLFVLCTTDPQRLPSTVLSRCQHFALRRLLPAQIGERLADVARREGLTLSAEATSLLTARAEGGLRDALALLDQVRAFAGDSIDREAVLLALGGLRSADTEELVHALESGAPREVLAWMDRRWGEGADPRQVAAALRDLWHEWMLEALATGTHAVVSPPKDWSPARLVSGLERFMRLARDARMTDDPRLALEVALVETVEGEREEDNSAGSLSRQVAELAERVAQLEQVLATRSRGTGSGVSTTEGRTRTVGSNSSVRSRLSPGVGSEPARVPGGGDWERILAYLRADHPRVAAILAEGRLEAVTPEDVQVRMPFEFHFQEIQRGENRALVEAALAAVYGGPRHLHVERAVRADAPEHR